MEGYCRCGQNLQAPQDIARDHQLRLRPPNESRQRVQRKFQGQDRRL